LYRYLAKQPRSLAAEMQVGLRPPLRTPAEMKHDKTMGHAREYMKDASFAGMMAAIKAGTVGRRFLFRLCAVVVCEGCEPFVLALSFPQNNVQLQLHVQVQRFIHPHLTTTLCRATCHYLEGQKPYPGAMSSPEWLEVYESRPDGSFFVKESVLKKEREKNEREEVGGATPPESGGGGGGGAKKKKGSIKKKTGGKKMGGKSLKAAKGGGLGAASADDASQQCAAGDASCAGGEAKKKGHEEL
jgi:hypothetical protein